jgi:hypothetical protein
VLAAEEFPVGASDAMLRAEHALAEPAHDVLAADEFPVGDADPILHAEHEILHVTSQQDVAPPELPADSSTPARARRRIVHAVAFTAALIVGVTGLRRRPGRH